jgi:hypothetical protein
VTDVTDVTLGASGLWQGTLTGAGGTTTLTESFFGRSSWTTGSWEVINGNIINLLSISDMI